MSLNPNSEVSVEMREKDRKMEKEKAGGGDGDIESGITNTKELLYPRNGKMETPELRWAFIRKVYFIITLQFLFTAAVAAVAVFVMPIPHFLKQSGWPSIVVSILIIILPLIIACPLAAFRKHHPWNMILLGLFTISVSLSVGLCCVWTPGNIILEATILTCSLVLGLTLYTFWAAGRGQDFSFMGPFLFASLLVLIIFAIIQIIFPLGELIYMIYSCLASIIFGGYIVYDTGNLIKRFTYDEYTTAAVALYLDVINLFFAMLTLSSAGDCD